MTEVPKISEAVLGAFAWDLAAALDIENIELSLSKIKGLATRLIDLGYSKNPPQIAETPKVYQGLIPVGENCVLVEGVKASASSVIVELYNTTTGDQIFGEGTSLVKTNGGALQVTTWTKAFDFPVMVRVIEL